MKHSLNYYKKYVRAHHYITVLKRQPVHIQHVYAALFAGSITALIAIAILYFDYGLWRETYTRNERGDEFYSASTTQEEQAVVVSPSDMIGNFFKEAGDKLENINNDKTGILEGTDSYTREE